MNEEEIKALQKQVKQIQKEYDILDGIIDIKDAVIAELKAKIKKYAAINEQETKDYAELKAENECLKQEFEIESLTDKTTGETIYRSNLVNKYKSCLQEIKAIAENREIFCENCSFCYDEFTCDDCGYVKILQKITKAEEE